jgi:subtilisin family serine protease
MNQMRLPTPDGSLGSGVLLAPHQWHVRQVSGGKAWTVTRGERAVIGVIDEGFDHAHPEFRGRIYRPLNVVTGGSDVRALEWSAHGTKVAGVACAGGIEVTGIAPGASILPVRLPSVLVATGSEDEETAIRYVASAGADVICCAWGEPQQSLSEAELRPSTRDAIRDAVTRGRNGKGCVVVFAAGNEGAPISGNPYAANPDVIAVGACNDEDRRPGYSNHGSELFCVFPSSDPTDPNQIHREIATTTPTGSFTLGETWYTDSFGRTSAACAGVAGLCALIISANPGLTGEQVREVLRESCVKISPEDARYDEGGHSPYYGYGRPDALAAVLLAQERR